ncbi:hypothetical protein Dimus_022066, partial [Dionaea muscipula]
MPASVLAAFTTGCGFVLARRFCSRISSHRATRSPEEIKLIELPCSIPSCSESAGGGGVSSPPPDSSPIASLHIYAYMHL